MSSVFYTTFEHLFWHYKLIIYIECASYTAGGTYCGVLVMATLFGLYPFLLKLYADGGYQGPQLRRRCVAGTRN